LLLIKRFLKCRPTYLVLLSIAVALSACSFPDKNIDPLRNNMQIHRQDMRDCAQAYPETADGAYLKQRVSCLELKGWR